MIDRLSICSCCQVYENPTETIDLRVFSSVKSSEDYTNRTHSFDVYSSDMVFSMVAATENEKEGALHPPCGVPAADRGRCTDWIRAIGRAIVISRTKSWQEDEDDKGDKGEKKKSWCAPSSHTHRVPE